jgi:hypothetical protein
MRLASGLLLLIAASGCRSAGCGTCGSACQPAVCCECHCYCRKLDDWHTAMNARSCAARFLSGRDSRDYRLGFTQAFVDVALGRTGASPPVPPERYWSVCFRSACGHDRVAEWYAGYRAGAELALAECGATCRTIPSSGAGGHFGQPLQDGGPAAAWGAPQYWDPSSGGCPCERYGR